MSCRDKKRRRKKRLIRRRGRRSDAASEASVPVTHNHTGGSHLRVREICETRVPGVTGEARAGAPSPRGSRFEKRGTFIFLHMFFTQKHKSRQWHLRHLLRFGTGIRSGVPSADCSARPTGVSTFSCRGVRTQQSEARVPPRVVFPSPELVHVARPTGRTRRASHRVRLAVVSSSTARFHRATHVMANVRQVPTVPFAASAVEGAVRKRATLSDTENLAVGAFGGVLETCIQSTSRSRSRARVSASTPLPLARLGSGVSSPRGTRVAPGRASPPPSAPSTCGLRTPDPEAFGVARAFNQSDLSPKIPRVASSRSCPPRRRDDKSQCP